MVVDVAAHMRAAIENQHLAARVSERAGDYGACEAGADDNVIDSEHLFLPKMLKAPNPEGTAPDGLPRLTAKGSLSRILVHS